MSEQPEQVDISSPEKVAEMVRKNDGKPVTMQVYFLHGIFGELPECNGVAEDVIDTDEKFVKWGLDPAEGGTYMKLLGCSYLYKGDPKQSHVFGMEQAKDMVSVIPRDIIGKSVIYIAALGLRFLLQKKKLINDLHIYFEGIRWKTIRYVSPPDIRLSKFTREIRRAMDAALKKELRIDPEYDLYNNTTPSIVRFTDLDFAGVGTKVTSFLTLIMEMDGAYRFPSQDALGELDKENARRSGAREFMRLIDVIIERNTNLTPMPGAWEPEGGWHCPAPVSDRIQGVPFKFRFIKRILQVIFLVSPQARRLAQRFLIELDVKKVALDDADWYYCLRRNTHNYRGVPLPERLAELERIDREMGHKYVKIEFKPPQPKAETKTETVKT